MTDVLLDVAFHAVLFFIVGIPIALALRKPSGGVASAIVDALAGGTVLFTVTVSLFGWLGVSGAILGLVVWAASIVYAILRRTPLPRATRPRGRGWILIVAWIVVLLGALALRLRSVNFLPWVGDMGAYVNWANEFARLGVSHATWPPLFSSYLAISSFVFGPSMTTAAIPFAGMLLILVVARVTSALGAGRWATLLAAAVVAVSVHAIWFSSFPASEALNAPLFAIWAGALLATVSARGTRERTVWAVASAIATLSLGLVRGDGTILLVPLFVFAVLALIVPDWRFLAVRVWAAFTGSTAGALVAYWYGIDRINRYFVTTQVHGAIPHILYRALDDAGLFTATIATAVIIVVGAAVVCAIGLLVARRVAPSARPTRAPRLMGRALGIALFLGIAANVVVNGEVWNIILREGLWLTIALVVLVAFIARARLAPTVLAFVLFLGFVAAVFLALQSYRMKVERGHAFFMYWDRYLFSEYIPIAFILFGVFLTAVWKLEVRGITVAERVRALAASDSRARAALPGVVGAVLALAIVIPALPQLLLIEKYTFMQGAYTLDAALVKEIPSVSTPVLWSATKPIQAPNFVFPNTWMAFAKPMARTFGYNVPDITNRSSDFDADLVLDATSIEQYAACSNATTVVVFESDLGGPTLAERVDSPDVTLTPIGTRTGHVELLSQPATRGWVDFGLVVHAWKATISPTALASATCPDK